MRLLDIIPDSISALVYDMRHPWLWTLGVWAIAFVGFLTMIPCDESYAGLAFATCACIAFVGAMPLLPGEHNTMHYVFGIAGCLLSQLWVAIVGNFDALFKWWLLYALVMMLMYVFGYGRKWCFVAEVWCLKAVVSVLIAKL